MNNSVIIYGIIIVITSVIIYLIKNFKSISEYLKTHKIINRILTVILFIIFAITIYILIKNVIFSYDWFKKSLVNDKINLKYDTMITDETKFYNLAISKEYENQNPQMPYIPEGFEYVEGEWNTGFVIQDENNNQYVWVPCTNKEDNDIVKLERINCSDDLFISKDTCANLKYENFIESALTYGGFYISRYEIGKEDGLPVSKQGMEILGELDINQVIEIIEKEYGNKNVKYDLINGYACDTTLNWICKTNNVSIKLFDSEKEEIYTGRNSYNNIYDFFDNVMELTLESNYNNVIVRGFINETDSNSIGELIKFDRYSILENRNHFLNKTPLAFRTVMYK